MARLLTRTPLTELATCTRETPPFAWGEAALALVATRPGRTLVLRALARLPAADVDAALGRATRELLATRRGAAAPAVTLLAERSLAEAERHLERTRDASGAPRPEEAFARGLGAAAAVWLLEAHGAAWPEAQRRRLLGGARSGVALGRGAGGAAMLGGIQ